jgi:hypothetical protein
MIFKKKDEWKPTISKERAKGVNMDAELKLLRYLAKNSTGMIAVEDISKYGDYLANVEALLIEKLLWVEKTNENGKIKQYYRISPNGYSFVREEEIKNRNKVILIVSISTLIISIIGLLLRFFKL